MGIRTEERNKRELAYVLRHVRDPKARVFLSDPAKTLLSDEGAAQRVFRKARRKFNHFTSETSYDSLVEGKTVLDVIRPIYGSFMRSLALRECEGFYNNVLGEI